MGITLRAEQLVSSKGLRIRFIMQDVGLVTGILVNADRPGPIGTRLNIDGIFYLVPNDTLVEVL